MFFCIAGITQLRNKGMRIGGRHWFFVIDKSKFAHKWKVGGAFAQGEWWILKTHFETSEK